VPVKNVFIAIIVLLGASLPIPAVACSCDARTVADIYDRAQVLALVRVGAMVPLVEADGKRCRTWPLELIETYKGHVTAEWLWSSGDSASCGAHLAAGAHYLISTNDDGYVGLCDVRRLPEDPTTDGEIEVLNAFKAGAIPVLTQPWTFAESNKSCRISHRFPSGRGELRFYFEPDTPGRHDARPPGENRGIQAAYEPGSVSLFVGYPFAQYLVEGTGRVIIGAKKWPTRRSLTEASWVSGYEVVNGKDALEILSELEDASSIAMAWEMHELPKYMADLWPEYPTGTAETSYVFVGDSIEHFRACLARGGLDEPAR
jgi:hypothetical protein